MAVTDDGVDDGLPAGDAEVCRVTSATFLSTCGCFSDVLLNLDDISGVFAGDPGEDDDAPDGGTDDDDGLPSGCLLRYVWMVLLWVIYLTLLRWISLGF